MLDLTLFFDMTTEQMEKQILELLALGYPEPVGEHTIKDFLLQSDPTEAIERLSHNNLIQVDTSKRGYDTPIYWRVTPKGYLQWKRVDRARRNSPKLAVLENYARFEWCV